MLDMGIISKRYVGHLLREFNNKKMIKINIEICTKSLPNISPQKAWQHVKEKQPSLLITREMQIKATMRSDCLPDRMERSMLGRMERNQSECPVGGVKITIGRAI